MSQQHCIGDTSQQITTNLLVVCGTLGPKKENNTLFAIFRLNKSAALRVWNEPIGIKKQARMRHCCATFTYSILVGNFFLKFDDTDVFDASELLFRVLFCQSILWIVSPPSR